MMIGHTALLAASSEVAAASEVAAETAAVAAEAARAAAGAAVQVPAGNILGILFSLAVTWGIPILLMVLIRRKYRADIVSFVLGCGSFFLFAMLLEQLLHMAVLLRMGGISGFLRENLWMYALYAGLAAGIFEETGRFLTMRFLMKKNLTRENALMYGAGHGGMEAVLILGVASINNLVNALLLNSGSLMESLASDPNAGQMLEALSPLGTLPAWQFFLGGGERILAVALQIALSLFVYRAVKDRRRWFFYPLAILIHAALDMAVVLTANQGRLLQAELLTLLGTLIVSWAAWRFAWKSGE